MNISEIEPEILDEINLFIAKINEEYDVNEVILFGSRARNTHNDESDIDLAVILNSSKVDFVTTKLVLADIAYDALASESCAIMQIMPIWLDEWENPATYSNPRLLENIKREGIVL